MTGVKVKCHHRRQRSRASPWSSHRSTVTVTHHDRRLWNHSGASSTTRHAPGGPSRGRPCSTAINHIFLVLELSCLCVFVVFSNESRSFDGSITGWPSIPSTIGVRISLISVLIREKQPVLEAVEAVRCILVRFSRTSHKSKPACDMKLSAVH